MIVHDVEQRSDAWRSLRAGRLCGSRAADMLATIQKGEAAARRNLRVQLVLERITGRSHDRGFQSQAMLDGIEREQAAIEAYEALSGRLLRSIGFVSHDDLMAGYSPDGVIGEFEGLIEGKCPIQATHMDFLRTGQVPGEYLKQILHGLWLTGAAWCDFVSFHPDFPEGAQLKVVRVERNELAIKDHDAKVRAFLAEVDRDVESFHTMLNLPATLAAAVGA